MRTTNVYLSDAPNSPKALALFTRIVNVLLMFATSLGVVSLIRDQHLESRLREERDRLSKKFGVMEVKDPSLFYLREVAQDERAHYVWRAHIPDQKQLFLKCQNISGRYSSSIGSSLEQETIRFRFGMRDGIAQFYIASNSGSSYGSLGISNELGQFLWDHWEELDVQIDAAETPIESDMRNVVTLLRVRVPEETRELVMEQIPDARRKRLDKRLSAPLVLLQCGTPEAMQDAE
ncbi:MAG: hypothetical protein ACR2NZ_19220 [Rubripirellula sp.]